MQGVHTSPIAAEVVNDETLGDRANKGAVRETMRRAKLLGTKHPIAFLIAIASPSPAWAKV